MNQYRRVDIFPHTGINIPVEIQNLIADKPAEKVKELIELNRDTGLEDLIEIFEKNPLPGQKILKFDIARVFCDANRATLSSQIPSKPYKGDILYKVTPSLASQLREKYIIPWQKKMVEIAKENPDAIFFSWHSMDKYGGGNYDLIKDKKEMRPQGQVITCVDYKADELRYLFPDLKTEYIRDHLIDNNVADFITSVFKELLEGYEIDDKEYFAKDKPYKLFAEGKIGTVSATSIPNMIDNAIGNKVNSQIALEFRKDLFATKQLVADLVTSSQEIVNYLNENSLVHKIAK